MDSPNKTMDTVLRPIECEHCKAKFSSKKVYNRHVKEVHLKVRIPCPKCQKPFSRLTRMKKHTEKCDGNGTTCHQCKQEFSSEELLRFHIEQIHNIQFCDGKTSHRKTFSKNTDDADNSTDGESLNCSVRGEGSTSTSFTPTPKRVNGRGSAQKRKRHAEQSDNSDNILNGIDADPMQFIRRVVAMRRDSAESSNEIDASDNQAESIGDLIKRRRQSSTEDRESGLVDIENPLGANGLVDNPLLQLISRGIDEAESFALSLVPTFRQLPKDKLQLAKIQINQLLFDLAYGDKLNDLNR